MVFLFIQGRNWRHRVLGIPRNFLKEFINERSFKIEVALRDLCGSHIEIRLSGLFYITTEIWDPIQDMLLKKLLLFLEEADGLLFNTLLQGFQSLLT